MLKTGNVIDRVYLVNQPRQVIRVFFHKVLVISYLYVNKSFTSLPAAN